MKIINLQLFHISIDFKNSKWLAYFCTLLRIIMHLLLFLSDWLIFCHMIISLI